MSEVRENTFCLRGAWGRPGEYPQRWDTRTKFSFFLLLIFFLLINNFNSFVEMYLTQNKQDILKVYNFMHFVTRVADPQNHLHGQNNDHFH